jgi:LPXTG-site transpeptidase (sortase) family protein
MSGIETAKNLVLAGHITVWDGTHGPFRYLSRLEPGAKIMVYTNQYIYTYQVREILIVKPEDAYLTKDTSNSQLTLLTCATWNEKTKSYLRRQVVFADLLEVEPYFQGMAK